jgi:hypothetical protein
VPFAIKKFLALSVQLLALHKSLNRGDIATSSGPKQSESSAQAGCELLFVTLNLLLKQRESRKDVGKPGKGGRVSRHGEDDSDDTV